MSGHLKSAGVPSGPCLVGYFKAWSRKRARRSGSLDKVGVEREGGKLRAREGGVGGKTSTQTHTYTHHKRGAANVCQNCFEGLQSQCCRDRGWVGVHPQSRALAWDANRAEAEAYPGAPLMPGRVSDSKAGSLLSLLLSSPLFTSTLTPTTHTHIHTHTPPLFSSALNLYHRFDRSHPRTRRVGQCINASLNNLFCMCT